MGHYAAEMGYNEELSSEELKEIYQREQKKTAEMFPSGWYIGLDLAKEGAKEQSL